MLRAVRENINLSHAVLTSQSIGQLAFLTLCDQALKSMGGKIIVFDDYFLWKDKMHNFLLVNNCLTLISFIVVKNLD